MKNITCLRYFPDVNTQCIPLLTTIRLRLLDYRCASCLSRRQYATKTKTKSEDDTSVIDSQNNSIKTQNSATNIQMLSEFLHKQIFHDVDRSKQTFDKETLNKIRSHLKKHDLIGKQTTILPDVSLKLPHLYGNNIDEHFKELGLRQSKDYVRQAELLCAEDLPPLPEKWVCAEGWTRYHRDGTVESIDYPDEEGLVFDVEILTTEGDFPTMATAASCNHWYSWCSRRVIDKKWQSKTMPDLSDMIPLESASSAMNPMDGTWKPRLVIGHNVSFDRSYIKEQYFIKGPRTRFLDTMSMHIAISGLTSFQRVLYVAKQKGSQRKELREMQDRPSYIGPPDFSWTKESSLNNLNDVYQLHCKGKPLKKAKRDVFVEGTMGDVRKQFQSLMTYCANDVKATYEVFKKLWPEFNERFPHPVTLAGMFEMSTAYLPVNHNWPSYIQESEATYADLQQELKQLLMRLANDACQLMEDEQYKRDPWLWDLDWSTRDYKKRATLTTEEKREIRALKKSEAEKTKEGRIKMVLTHARHNVTRNSPHMSGYPKWYADLCPKGEEEMEEYGPGPSKINTLKRATPKLLRMTWDGYPLHYNSKEGWGYLIPGKEHMEIEDQEEQDENKITHTDFPYKECVEACRGVMKVENPLFDSEARLDQLYEALQDATDDEEKSRLWKQITQLQNKQKKHNKSQADEKSHPFWRSEADWPFLRDVAPHPKMWFYKLPNKDGPSKNVGNPLAKDFLSKIEDGTLQAGAGDFATLALTLNKMCAYWKNNKDRISCQVMLPLSKADLPLTVTRHKDYEEDGLYGAILPRIVTAGTVTRRAVEPTWLTASNAYVDRVGSELKAMVQSPPGYHFVGADVDSQELWIAAVLGDAYFAGLHGCTAFGWMTLQGNKVDGTDLHSRTATLVGITRDQAKIFNYGRIYGAGMVFAERLLRQFNHQLSREQAKAKARAMYHATKGKRRRSYESLDEDPNKDFQLRLWEGGSESAMFNQLEKVAQADKPSTPVLGARISKALEPGRVSSDFMTSRVNWVVQSSAVDYLHLMLVCMRWLFEEFNINGRFCISIHDEVRYLVASKDRYRAALALQITNLLTRSMFAYKLNMYDLPQSVAFFSAVDIDTCLRKEVTMDCRTPSNPRGLQRGYGIPSGEALSIYKILSKTNSTLVENEQPELES